MTYTEKGGILEIYKDIPKEIKDEFHMEEQQRQEKDKRKNENTYPSINIT